MDSRKIDIFQSVFINLKFKYQEDAYFQSFKLSILCEILICSVTRDPKYTFYHKDRQFIQGESNYFNSSIAKQETYSQIQTQTLSIFRRLKTRMSNFLHSRSKRSLRLSIQKISNVTRGKNEYKLAGIIIFNECGLRFNE